MTFAPRAAVRVASSAFAASLALVSIELAAVDVRAAPPPALVIELADAEPIGVIVERPLKGCGGPAKKVFEAVLEKGKPVLVASDAYPLCVRQTSAPFTKVGHGPPFVVHHLPGTAPIRLMLRSRADDGAPTLVPQTPLVFSVDGAERIGVRVSTDVGSSCDAPGKPLLYAGVLEPDRPIALFTHATCVCYQQTSAPFVSAGWSPGQVRCRPRRCLGTTCVTDLEAPFTLALPSRLP